MTRCVTIRSEGGLIPPDTIEQLLRGELPGQKPADFGLERGRHIGDEIARAWSDAQNYWDIFRRRLETIPETGPATTLTRERWVLLLLGDLLGYELTYQPAGAQIGGKTYPISHRAGDGEEAPPVHIVGVRQDLDRRDEVGHRRMSPQALVQEYLNRSEHLWGLVTNGLRLRVLRDTTRTARPTYLEFDLQSILDGGRFNEFVVLYRLCHRTRLPKTLDDAKDCLLERYYQASIDEGLRVRDRLRDGVEAALTRIGAELLQHPANDALRARVRSGRLSADAYYRQLLRLVYRLLFLMVAEERQMVLIPAADGERRQRVYDRHYSLRRLRDLAERPFAEGLHGDLWVGLQQTFRLFTNGMGNPLGIPPLNGHLFGPEAIPDLEDTGLFNHDLLVAIRRLSVFEAGGVPARINYAGLGVEELGSVYESLLDFHPVIERQNGVYTFALEAGTERKSTGSYYTPPELVSELIHSALVPVLEDRLATAGAREEREQAILTMTVCDPACGSGHFLLAAGRRLARELAGVRTGEDEPTPEEFRRALRDVIQSCLFGVDKNPLAVDLCKVALWIEGHSPGLPLSFLDHRIKCGDSLVGVFSMEQLAEGIPDEAYAPVFGDDKEVARALRRRNAQERKSRGRQLPLLEQQMQEHSGRHATAYAALAALPQDTAQQVHEMERRYREIHGEGSSWWRDWTAATLWTAAFYVPREGKTETVVPTTDHLRDWLAGMPLPARMGEAINALADELRPFHWPLEYPEVFARGGFDVVLGNPPWGLIKLVEQEFFAPRDSLIATAPNKAARERLISRLKTDNPPLYEAFAAAKHLAEAQSRFARCSSRYPLSAVGDMNTYALFVEMGRGLLQETGRLGMVVPTGLVTSSTTRLFFADLVTTRALVSFLGMDNEKMIFPGIDHRNRFGLLCLAGEVGHSEAATLAFFCSRVDWIADPRRRFSLTPDEIRLVNPNTRTCPVFRTLVDAGLARKVYERVPVLVNDEGRQNPWDVSFLRVFDMSGDSGLFRTKHVLDTQRCRLKGNHFVRGADVWLPLYEAKMFHLYDHRWGDYALSTDAQRREGSLAQPNLAQRHDPYYRIMPRYWVPKKEVDARLRGWNWDWLIAFRRVASATLERTMVATILPRVGTNDKAALLLPKVCDAGLVPCLLGNLASLVFDYLVRQKVAGTQVDFFVLEQLPVLPPSTYTPEDRQFIRERVLELVYSSSELEPFARDLGCDAQPFEWDEARRAHLRAGLDAYFAHLYGLARDEVRYILDPQDVCGEDFPSETFRVLKEREEKEHGEYRTRRLVLEAYDELAKTSRFGGRTTAVISRNPLRKDG